LWNLLIDVVAQSGRYSPNAGALDQFFVEGEKRYWMHVAIDRYTGEVVDKQVEQATE
jgi:chloramphenicol 3-O-phosphotransferase